MNLETNTHPFFQHLENYQEFLPDFRGYLTHLKEHFPTYLRINTLKISVEEAEKFLTRDGAILRSTAVPEIFQLSPSCKVPSLSYHLGFIYPQALTSAMPVLAMELQGGERVLDLCAAPGGKTGYMAQVMKDNGVIVANDRKLGRIISLMSNLKRLGITSAVVIQSRGEQLTWSHPFDRILVDAPCSGEGKYRIDAETGRLLHARRGRTNLSAIQKALIQRGFDLLEPGGIMIYSTCTLTPEENEEVVAHLLKKRKAALVQWKPPVESSPGLEEYRGKRYGKELGLAHRFYPHKVNSVGFFLAKIVKPK